MIGLTLAAVLLYTLLACLFKFASSRTRPDQVVTVATLVVALCAVGVMAWRNEWSGSWQGAMLAVSAGVLFYFSSVYQLQALRTSSTSMVFAITSLNLVLAGMLVLFVPMFDTDLTLPRVLAIMVAGAAILLSLKLDQVDRLSRSVLVALLLLALCTITYTFYTHFFQEILFYIAVNHVVGALINWRKLPTIKHTELRWGLLLGVCMFGAFWSLLQALALSANNAPLVLLALNIKTPLTALLAVPLFKERVTPKKVLAVMMATWAVVLWRM